MTISHLHPKNTRSSDFRFVFSDTSGVQFAVNQAIVTFSIQHNPADLTEGAEEQVAVAMTGVALKALAYSVNRIIDHYEKTSGAVIPLPDGISETMDKAVAAAGKTTSSKK
jgi:hypothetical protein